MILSDRDIQKVIKEKRLIFKPALSKDQIGPASIDLKLGRIFKSFNISKQSMLDTKKGLPDKSFISTRKLKDNEPFILHPTDFVLASTKEYVKVSDDLVLKVEGKSTLARMGILVHTAGFVDPGFEGTLTLEISNQSKLASIGERAFEDTSIKRIEIPDATTSIGDEAFHGCKELEFVCFSKQSKLETIDAPG